MQTLMCGSQEILTVVLPDEQQQLSPEVRQLADEMKASRGNGKYFQIPTSSVSPGLA